MQNFAVYSTLPPEFTLYVKAPTFFFNLCCTLGFLKTKLVLLISNDSHIIQVITVFLTQTVEKFSQLGSQLYFRFPIKL